MSGTQSVSSMSQSARLDPVMHPSMSVSAMRFCISWMSCFSDNMTPFLVLQVVVASGLLDRLQDLLLLVL